MNELEDAMDYVKNRLNYNKNNMLEANKDMEDQLKHSMAQIENTKLLIEANLKRIAQIDAALEKLK